MPYAYKHDRKKYLEEVENELSLVSECALFDTPGLDFSVWDVNLPDPYHDSEGNIL